LAQISKTKVILSLLFSLQLLLGSLLTFPVITHGLSNYNLSSSNNTNAVSHNESTKIRSFGMWAPYQVPLESIRNKTIQMNAINAILKQGYNEYYFAPGDFRSKIAVSMTENLLQSVDGTKLKIIIILLPPSEAGPKGNFDWKGWIEYLNSLKAKHPLSLDGFVIDDFNLFSNNQHIRKNNVNSNNHNDAKNNNIIKFPKDNVNFMLKSNFEWALQKKRKDLHFYPILYFEGVKTNDVKRHYYNYTDGIVLASTDYYNVTELAHNLNIFSKVFNNKPITYVVYTARTSKYIDQNYSPPSDRLILSTLSIANKSQVVKGIVIWRNTNSHVVRDYLSNLNNTEYLSFVAMMEKLQIRDENGSSSKYGTYDLSTQEQQQSKNGKSHKSIGSSSSSSSSSTTPSTPRLGISISDLDPSLAEDMGLPKNYKGAVAQSVIPGSPAYKAGIKGTILDVDKSGYLIKKGDVIISVDGHKVNRAEDILKQLKKKHLGDLLTLIVNRSGNIINMAAKLEPY
jgi:hypothetical protein